MLYNIKKYFIPRKYIIIIKSKKVGLRNYPILPAQPILIPISYYNDRPTGYRKLFFCSSNSLKSKNSLI